MAKKLKAVIKLQVPAGKANPAPPVGPALGQHGVNIMEFCKTFNDRTKQDEGLIIPVVINVNEDRSFTFVTKTPPASILLKRMLKIEKGSGMPNKSKVAKISRAKIKDIAKQKMPDLTANSIESAMKIIEGTARSMGIDVVGEGE